MIRLAVAATAMLIISTTAAGAAADAAADNHVPVPHFKSIELRGGGTVILRHGPRQEVRLIKGDRSVSDIRVEEGGTVRVGRDVYNTNPDRLVIDACRTSCGRYELVVEVITPEISALAVKGGGTLRSQGAFPVQGNVGVAVGGGGAIDLRSMPVNTLGAAVSGGGTIRVRVDGSLGASINGGGEIIYWGEPVVGQTVRGGGTVRPGA